MQVLPRQAGCSLGAAASGDRTTVDVPPGAAHLGDEHHRLRPLISIRADRVGAAGLDCRQGAWGDGPGGSGPAARLAADAVPRAVALKGVATEGLLVAMRSAPPLQRRSAGSAVLARQQGKEPPWAEPMSRPQWVTTGARSQRVAPMVPTGLWQRAQCPLARPPPWAQGGFRLVGDGPDRLCWLGDGRGRPAVPQCSTSDSLRLCRGRCRDRAPPGFAYRAHVRAHTAGSFAASALSASSVTTGTDLTTPRVRAGSGHHPY